MWATVSGSRTPIIKRFLSPNPLKNKPFAFPSGFSILKSLQYRMFKSFAARLSIVFFSLSALVLVVLFTFFYFRATQIRDQAFERYIGNLTELSARMIPGEEVQAVPLTEGCEKLPQTQALIQKLRAFQSIDPNFFDVYLMVRDDDPNFLRFVTNADRERTPVGCGERYPVKDDPEILKGFQAPFVSLSAFTDKWGTWVGAYAPVKTASGEVVALLGMDLPRETLKHIQASFLERFIVAIVVC
jgi:methyl-accepting chemotaxis protein